MSEPTVQVSMSATVGKLAGALAKAQAKMAPATKDATNPHFKNRYATLASCVEAVKPLHENGIAVVQPPAIHGPDGVTVRTLLVHESGEWICGELYMPATKKDAQGFGSALSYARRYCLTSTCGLATDDDDANTAVKPQKQETQNAPITVSVSSQAWLRAAQSILSEAAKKGPGELLSKWADINEQLKELKPPQEIVDAITATKDALKKSANGAKA